MMYENEPRTIGGVLDAGVSLYRSAFRGVTITALKGFGVLFLVETVFELAFGVSSASLNAADPVTIDAADVFLYLGLLPINLVVTLITVLAILVQLHRVATGEPDADVGVYKAAFGRALPYLGTSLLYGLAVIVGLILLIIPGVYLSIALLPCGYLVIIEGLGPMAALSRAMKLVRGNWWRTMTVVLVASVIAMVIQTGVVTVPAFATGVVAATTEELSLVAILLLNFLTSIAQSLSSPIAMAMGLAIVRDLVLRESGEDLEARLDAVGS